MGVMSGYLFIDGGELRDYLDSLKAMLVEEVQKAPEGHVLQADVEACLPTAHGYIPATSILVCEASLVP
jgi:hypothetical protein